MKTDQEPGLQFAIRLSADELDRLAMPAPDNRVLPTETSDGMVVMLGRGAEDRASLVDNYLFVTIGTTAVPNVIPAESIRFDGNVKPERVDLLTSNPGGIAILGAEQSSQ